MQMLGDFIRTKMHFCPRLSSLPLSIQNNTTPAIQKSNIQPENYWKIIIHTAHTYGFIIIINIKIFYGDFHFQRSIQFHLEKTNTHHPCENIVFSVFVIIIK